MTGAGLATLISRIMMPLVFMLIILLKKEYKRYLVLHYTDGDNQQSSVISLARIKEIFIVGYRLCLKFLMGYRLLRLEP